MFGRQKKEVQEDGKEINKVKRALISTEYRILTIEAIQRGTDILLQNLFKPGLTVDLCCNLTGN